MMHLPVQPRHVVLADSAVKGVCGGLVLRAGLGGEGDKNVILACTGYDRWSAALYQMQRTCACIWKDRVRNCAQGGLSARTCECGEVGRGPMLRGELSSG